MVSLRVSAAPMQAFDVFTQEIGAWWRPNKLFQITPEGDGQLAFEIGENGRLVATLADGEVYEIGRITIWRPGERLAFSWRPASFAPHQVTHVDVRFEATGEGTRITVEHRGWDAIPQDHAARHGFPLTATQMRLAEHWRTLLAVAFGLSAGSC